MTRRRVIAIVCDVIHPYSHGGRELRNQELLGRLAERAEVHVYTMNWWNGPRVFSDGGITYHAISRLRPLYSGDRRSLAQAVYFGLASLRLLGCRFDVLEADQIPYFQLFVLRVVATLKRRPFTVTWHEVWSRSYWREYLGWAGWIAWSVEWLAMHLPDQIIAASPQTAGRLRAILGERTPITPIPNGIDLSNVSAACPDAEESDLVVVGRLMNHKRVGLLLQVVALLHAQGMPITCRIIGDGPERAALQEQARRLRILPAVEFRDDVSEQKELYALVKAARLFVSLSSREGFGIAVLEAIACGVPVLTTSEPDNFAQHLVARYSKGVVCEPGLQHIVTAVKQVLTQHEGSAERGYGPESWVAEYDWGTMADRLAGVYQA